MASTDATSKPFGMAIVGCGQIVTHHLTAMAKKGLFANNLFRVKALVDPNPERRHVLQEQLKSQQPSSSVAPLLNEYSTLEELLSNITNDDIDVIFMAVPHDLHYQLAVQAMTSVQNKIIVMEKPLAPTLEQCQRLVELSSKNSSSTTPSNNMLIVAEQSPYWEEVVLAKKLIQKEGAIGRVVSAASYYYESMRDNVTSGDVASDGCGLGWRGSLQRAGGGIAIDGGLHWIRPIREMLGTRIANVVAVTRSKIQPSLQMEGESIGHALFEMEPPSNDDVDTNKNLIQPEGSGPLVATYSCNMLATAPMAHDACPYFRITGDQGEIIIHGDGLFKDQPGCGGLKLYNTEHPYGKEMFPSDRKGGFFLGFAGLWERIHEICIHKDKVAAHETVVRASDDVKVVLAMYKSAKTRQWVAT